MLCDLASSRSAERSVRLNLEGQTDVDYDDLSEMLRAAQQSHALGNLGLAEVLYSDALVGHPLDRESLLGLTRLKIQRADFCSASRHIDTLLLAHHDDPDAHYLKALLAHKVENKMVAQFHLAKALASRPDFFEAHHLLAEILLSGPFYREVLKEIHRIIQPRIYLEIGVGRGKSLALATGAFRAIGVDPAPSLSFDPDKSVDIRRMTSDQFFEEHAPRLFSEERIDLSFIDGQHHADQALLDVLNCEKFSKQESVILIHDVVPLDALTAQRERRSFFWSGDVWKVIIAMKEFLPDLQIETFDSPPTGLAMLRGLNPERCLPRTKIREIQEFMRTMTYEASKANSVTLVRYAPQILEATTTAGAPAPQRL